MSNLPHPKYRADIDGLRAVAVLSVVAFHAFPLRFQGGFVGVDVFFVISGFLISTILLGSLEHGGFSFAAFYARRVKRIFPALLTVMVCTLGFGWWVLFASEFRQLGLHLAGGAAFVSNLLLWSESGYFDSAADLKPLLHLWSLAIEEQFYIFWPLLLWLASGRKRGLLLVTLAIAALSFGWNLHLAQRDPTADFYSPATRCWELMLGGLLAYVQAHRPQWNQRWRHAQSVLGLVLMAAALLLIDRASVFPGAWALLPTLAAVCLIAAGPEALVNRTLLASRPMVWFGLISYPLYLWHWPILSYARILTGKDVLREHRMAAVALSILLAWLTYRLIELPLRRAAPRRATAALVALMLLVGTAGALLAWGGQPRNASAALQRIFAATEEWDYPGALLPAPAPGAGYYARGNGAAATMLLGDSHIEQYGPRVTALLRQNGAAYRDAVFMTAGGCAPVPDVLDDAPIHLGCAAMRAQALRELAAPRYTTVVVGACWNCYFIDQAAPAAGADDAYDYYVLADGRRHSFRRQDGRALALARLETLLAGLARSKRVYLLLDNPSGPEYDPGNFLEGGRLDTIRVRTMTPTTPLSPAQQALRLELKALAARAGAAVIDPVEQLCRDGQCLRLQADGTPVYKNINHLRPAYVRGHADYLDQALLAQ
ncbi:MAG: acyltransferase family protein [Pseudomonadota bacterium]